jgi:pimeloyl-ACP methyl ester carboxylesterase
MFGLHLTYKYLSYSAPPADAPIPPPPDGLERHFLQTPSGRIELLYATPPTSTSPSSLPNTTPVLFVHGGMGSAWVWTPYLLYLASHGVPCYAVSMRGHGNSWYPSYLRMTFGTFRSDVTDDVLAALEYVEEKHREKVLLVGHSSGGGLSQGMLSDGKAKVKGLALLGAVPCFGS